MPYKNDGYAIPIYRLQMVRDGSITSHTITEPKDVLKSIRSFALSDRELFVGLYMNTRNQIIGYHVISAGTLNATPVHPREVFKFAILKNACRIVLAHNHPSGNPSPSLADFRVTHRLTEAGKILGIEIVDHIIITPDGKANSIKK